MILTLATGQVCSLGTAMTLTLATGQALALATSQVIITLAPQFYQGEVTNMASPKVFVCVCMWKFVYHEVFRIADAAVPYGHCLTFLFLMDLTT